MGNEDNSDILKWLFGIWMCGVFICLLGKAFWILLGIVALVVLFYILFHKEKDDFKKQESEENVSPRLLYPHFSKTNKNEGNTESVLSIVPTESDCADMRMNYPHGLAEFRKLHPDYSWNKIWEYRIDVWRLEHDYKLRMHDVLRDRYPHGYEIYMKRNPHATIQVIIKDVDEIKKLEEEYGDRRLDALKSAFPHGYDAYMQEHTDATNSIVIADCDHIAQLEKKYLQEVRMQESKNRTEEEELKKKNNESALDARLECLIQRISKLEKRNPLVLEKLKTLKDAGDGFRNMCQDWKKLNGGFIYSWLFYYYPQKVSFVVPSRDDENRKIVWNFKNDPARNIRSYAHERALDYVLPLLCKRLILLYGRKNLKDLTLVCVPASSQVKNKARYESFSSKLCEKTGMENGYEHIHFIKDGISKNDPNNSSGNSIRPEIVFDDWFDGKFVVLFDDVVTKGDTMLYYKQQLKKVDAIVVGGICLGQTRHTQQTTMEILENLIEQKNLREEEERQTQLEIKEIIEARLPKFQEEDEESTGA